MQPLNVEIWSDIVCPWCYIGKRRFETALAQFAHRDQVAIQWRSFELDPRAPRHTPGSMAALLAQKKGMSVSQATAMTAQVTAVAAQEGLDYRFDQVQHANSFDAHRLVHLAATYNLQSEAKERLMHVYFTDGLLISDPETLVTLGTELGIPADAVRAMLESDAYADEVRADERRGSAFGIRGVPFFVLDEKYGVSGAQPAEVFLDALKQAWQNSHPLTLVSSGGDAGSCDDESCAIPSTQEQSGVTSV